MRRAASKAGRLATPSGAVAATHGDLKQLFTPQWRYTTALVWTVWFTTLNVYYGIVLFTTVLFKHPDECVGGAGAGAVATVDETVVASEGQCALDCKGLQGDDYMDLVLTTLGEFGGVLVAFLLVDVIGRKRTTAVLLALAAAGALGLFVCAGRTWMTIMLFVVRGGSIGSSMVMYAYTSEVYGTTYRGAANGAASAVARLGGIVTPLVAQVVGSAHPNVTIGIYAVCCGVGAVAALLLPIETKGRELQDT